MLEKLAKHHDLWIKMLINLGCDVETSKDLVQDMYLKLHRLVKDTGRICIEVMLIDIMSTLH